MHKNIFIFIDGLGIGKANKDNPFYLYSSPVFSHFKNKVKTKNRIEKGYLFSLDANLGVEGIPQSATGQSAIFTGINTAKLLNRHLFGFPNAILRKLLMKDNILLDFSNQGYRTVFFNCYPYYAELLSQGNLKIDEEGNFIINQYKDKFGPWLKYISTTTIMALSIQQRFFGLNDLIKEKTIYQDFTNRLLRTKLKHVPIFTSQKAGEILLKSLDRFDFVLYEYFQTDRIGHKQDKNLAQTIAADLDIFINTILHNIDLNKTNLFIVSDHGNFEDLSIKNHTTNKVPFYLFTKKKINCEINSLVDVMSVVRILN